jgi:hypothetical protein
LQAFQAQQQALQATRCSRYASNIKLKKLLVKLKKDLDKVHTICLIAIIMAAAQGLQGIGSAQQQDALSRIQALGGIGAQDRALRQASMDMGYDDFQRQRDFAKNQLSDFSGMLRGVPVQPNQTTSTYSQQPGLFQGAVSAGLGGLGLYRGMGG